MEEDSIYMLQSPHVMDNSKFYQILSDPNINQVNPEVYMTIIGLLVAMPILNFNFLLFAKPFLNEQKL